MTDDNGDIYFLPPRFLCTKRQEDSNFLMITTICPSNIAPLLHIVTCPSNSNAQEAPWYPQGKKIAVSGLYLFPYSMTLEFHLEMSGIFCLGAEYNKLLWWFHGYRILVTVPVYVDVSITAAVTTTEDIESLVSMAYQSKLLQLSEIYETANSEIKTHVFWEWVVIPCTWLFSIFVLNYKPSCVLSCVLCYIWSSSGTVYIQRI